MGQTLSLIRQSDTITEDRKEIMENQTQEELRLSSHRFGEFTYTRDAVIDFPHGLIGFEDLHAFIIADIPGCEPFQWLICLDNATIGFPIIRAEILDASYAEEVYQEFDLMHGLNPEQVVSYIIATLPDQLEEATVNLRAPVVINLQRHSGQQIILVSDELSAEHPLFTTACAEETPSGR